MASQPRVMKPVRRFFTQLGINVLALAAIVVAGFGVFRGASAVVAWDAEGRLSPTVTALLLGAATFYASLSLAILLSSYRVLLHFLGAEPGFRGRLEQSRSDHWNRRLVDLITIATFVFPLIRLEFLSIASPGPAVAKGFVVGLAAALAARLHARAQYREAYSVFLPLLAFVMFVAINSAEFADPERWEWLSGLVLLAVLAGERALSGLLRRAKAR